jgi:lysophospholipase L1-like esterase
MAVSSRSNEVPRRVLCTLVGSLLVIAACSSPTRPTPPPTVPPPVTPVPPRPPLTIACPASVTVASTTGAAVPVTFNAPATTGGVEPILVSCTRASGTAFAVGAATVQCTATDAANASTSCAFTVTVTPPIPQLSRTRFLAFGDSMTIGEVSLPTSVPLSDGMPNFRLVVIPTASYPTQLLSQLRARYTGQTATLQVTNAGAPGEWAEDGAIRLPGVMSNLRPEAVLLMEGINELGALDTPGVMRAWRAIDLMAKEIRGRGARAFLATLPPSRVTGAKALPNSRIEALNALIRTTARGEGAVLVDVYAALSPDPNRYIGVDGLHPSEAGYQKIAETFFAAIRADLEIVPR